MEYAVIATPDDALGLRLDWERFSYAGKFVMTNTGKAVAVEDGVFEDPEWPPNPREAQTTGVVGAVSFNRDRGDPDTAWLRYVTVRASDRGRGVAPRLCAVTVDWLLDNFDVTSVRIAVNNPYAFDALYKAGFDWTGATTGLRERVLEYPPPGEESEPDREQSPGRSPESSYVAGLRSYLDTDITEDERAFIESRVERGPPARVDVPKGEDYTGGGPTRE